MVLIVNISIFTAFSLYGHKEKVAESTSREEVARLEISSHK